MEMTETQALGMVNTPQDSQNVEPKKFTQVDDYTTFRAEFMIEDGDIVFHFFMAPELLEAAKKLAEYPVRLKTLDEVVRKYWLDSFPRSLDVVARDFFKTDNKRLAATYVDDYELKSWWLKAKGFANEGLNPAARALALCERLDQALDAVKVNLALV